MDEDGLIVTMILDTFEEQTSAERRKLKRRDVNVDAKLVPCVCAYGVGKNSANEAIKVEEEEQGSEKSRQR